MTDRGMILTGTFCLLPMAQIILTFIPWAPSTSTQPTPAHLPHSQSTRPSPKKTHPARLLRLSNSVPPIPLLLPKTVAFYEKVTDKDAALYFMRLGTPWWLHILKIRAVGVGIETRFGIRIR
ncbi:hypothetical protein QBC47DRAFT_378176 [Echria macrotheca]|uniref:Uncharacterized protein n=1 Tax=Echria macrotheca TaxID=438768 RepID=A0AAJ0BET4_9PEZI|nr:hypothetical protein QBC47DRAFT_378176 [Echria macrotheca]